MRVLLKILGKDILKRQICLFYSLMLFIDEEMFE